MGPNDDVPKYVESSYIKFKNQTINSQYKYSQPLISQKLDIGNTQIYNPSAQKRKQLNILGSNYLKKQQKMMAVVILAGGYGCRSGQLGTKQFRQINLNQIPTNLINIALKTIFRMQELQVNITLYIVFNKYNSKNIIKQVQQLSLTFPKLSIYLCYQDTKPILDSYGRSSIVQNLQQKKNLFYPSGVGSFLQSRIIYGSMGDDEFKLKEHILQICEPEFVYCFGTSNLYESGVDCEMVGLLASKPELGCVFKTFSHENSKEQATLVCTREGREGRGGASWLTMEYANLQKLMKNSKQVKGLPVWIDNFIFRASYLDSPLASSHMQYEFKSRNLKNKNNDQIPCLIVQKTISSTVLRNMQGSIGYAVSKDTRKKPYLMTLESDFQNLTQIVNSVSEFKKTQSSSSKNQSRNFKNNGIVGSVKIHFADKGIIIEEYKG